MKKLTFLFALALLVSVSFALPSRASAQEDVVAPGITPDSTFYFIDTAWENLGTFFTFGKKAKTERYTRLAEERLAEAEVMAEEGNIEALNIAKNKYDETIERTERHIEKFIDDAELESIIAEATGIHESILERVLAKAPEEAREDLENAIERSDRRHRDHLEKLADLDEERAAEISARVEEGRLIHIRDIAADKEVDPEDVKRALESHDKYRDFVRGFEEERDEFRAGLTDHLSATYDTVYDLEALTIDHLSPELRDEIFDRAEKFIEEHTERLQDLTEEDIERAAGIHSRTLEAITREIEARPELDASLRDRLIRDTEIFREIGMHIVEQAAFHDEAAVREKVLQTIEESTGIHIDILNRVIENTPDVDRLFLEELIEAGEIQREDFIERIRTDQVQDVDSALFEEKVREELIRQESEGTLDSATLQDAAHLFDQIREEFLIEESSMHDSTREEVINNNELTDLERKRILEAERIEAIKREEELLRLKILELQGSDSVLHTTTE